MTKLIWLSVVLIVVGTIGVILTTTNSALVTNAKQYVESYD